MPVKSPVKSKQNFFSRLIPKTRKAKIITTVALFAIVGGGFMVYRSFAATTANYTSGSFVWSWDGSRKYTNRVSSNGTLCIDHLGYNLDSAWGAATRKYDVRLFTLVNGKWQQSREYSANFTFDTNRKNYDRTCYRKLVSAYVYRVQFDPVSDITGGSLYDRASAQIRYKIYGYDVEKGETSATSKNPNNTTPAPAPAPAPPAQTSKNP